MVSRAAEITCRVEVPDGAGNAFSNCAPFDPARGRLTQVSWTVQKSVQWDAFLALGGVPPGQEQAVVSFHQIALVKHFTAIIGVPEPNDPDNSPSTVVALNSAESAAPVPDLTLSWSPATGFPDWVPLSEPCLYGVSGSSSDPAVLSLFSRHSPTARAFLDCRLQYESASGANLDLRFFGAGSGFTNAEFTFLYQPVPEPGSLMTAAGGLLAVATDSWRRRRRKC